MEILNQENRDLKAKFKANSGADHGCEAVGVLRMNLRFRYFCFRHVAKVGCIYTLHYYICYFNKDI